MIEEQIQQQLREKYNPDGSDLRNMQLQLLDILKKFDAICQKHHIPYWLDSGTLIGAVRHGGFIPWDDDIDVCVLLKDYKKLRKILVKELSTPYLFQDSKTDKTFHRAWARILNTEIVVERYISPQKRTIRNNLWIDILPIEEGSVCIKRKVEKLYGRCYRRISGEITDGYVKKWIARILTPALGVLISLLRCANRIFCSDTYIHRYGVEFYSYRKKTDVFPLVMVKFEDEYFYAPRNAHNYLSRIYHDYENIPSEEEIETHGFVFKRKKNSDI